MDKSTIIDKLREHEGELKAAGVEHLFLHGSYARGTAIREVSDVDLMAEFDAGGNTRCWTGCALKAGSPICSG
jgi:predicted nucleotidyltransferase